MSANSTAERWREERNCDLSPTESPPHFRSTAKPYLQGKGTYRCDRMQVNIFAQAGLSNTLHLSQITTREILGEQVRWGLVSSRDTPHLCRSADCLQKTEARCSLSLCIKNRSCFGSSGPGNLAHIIRFLTCIREVPGWIQYRDRDCAWLSSVLPCKSWNSASDVATTASWLYHFSVTKRPTVQRYCLKLVWTTDSVVKYTVTLLSKCRAFPRYMRKCTSI